MVKIKTIKSTWKMSPTADPFFSYDENGLNVYFQVYQGDETRNKELSEYLLTNKLDNDSCIPDEIYNCCGFAIIHFIFRSFDSLQALNRIEWQSKTPHSDEVTTSVLEEYNLHGGILKYHFVGHDIVLSVTANTYTEIYFDK